MFGRTTCMITNAKKIIRPEHIIWTNGFIVARELFPFLMKCLLMNLFQGQFVPLHYLSQLCIILHEKCTPIYANRRFLVLFFFQPVRNLSSSRDQIWWHTICIPCLQSRGKLKKYIFSIQYATWEKKRHSLKMKTCKGTCGTCSVVSHS